MCPVCRRRLTKGVEQRIEELADRPADFTPENSIGFRRLLPLSEIVATVLGTDSPSTQKVWTIYNALIEKFSNEYRVLIEARFSDLLAVSNEKVAEMIVRVREGRVRVIPGYDGLYGRLDMSGADSNAQAVPERVQQMNLTDFFG